MAAHGYQFGMESHMKVFILTLKIWSSGPGIFTSAFDETKDMKPDIILTYICNSVFSIDNQFIIGRKLYAAIKARLAKGDVSLGTEVHYGKRTYHGLY